MGKDNDSHNDTEISDAKTYTILAVNPGSTSTKLALFNNDRCVKVHEVAYAHQSGLTGTAFDDEVDRYVNSILRQLSAWGIKTLESTGMAEDLKNDRVVLKMDAVVGRGGFMNRQHTRIETGVYEVATCEAGHVTVHPDIVQSVRDSGVTEAISDITNANECTQPSSLTGSIKPEMDHASNLGIPIAARLAEELRCSAYTVDPVVADDFEPVARYSGYTPIERRSIAHVLSIRAMARKAAKQLKRPLEQCQFVVVHLGGGITVAAVRDGKMVDNSIALLGEGPFTPQRAGTLPQQALIDLCYSGRFSKEELFRELTKRSGLISYLGEDDIIAIEKRIADGDPSAALALNAMIYQIAKEVGAMHIAAGGAVQAIIISGGMAKSNWILDRLKSYTEKLAPTIVFTDHVELEAMACGALSVLRGEYPPKQYRLQRRTIES